MITGKELKTKIIDYWGRRFSLPPERFSQPGSLIYLEEKFKDSHEIYIHHLGKFYVVRIDPQVGTRLGLNDRQDSPDRFGKLELNQLVADQLKGEAVLKQEGSASYSYLDGRKFIPFSAGGRQDPVMLDPKTDQGLIRTLCSACPPGDVEEAELEEDQEPDAVSFGHIMEGKLMAYSGFRYWDKIFGDIGVLTHPAARGRGLARSATSMLCAWCLENDVIPMYRVSGDNLASSRIPPALGFTRMVEIDALKVEP